MPRYIRESENSSGGIGLFGVLQIVFIVLKLCGLISWSWWCVFIPSFISLGIFLLAILLLIGG